MQKESRGGSRHKKTVTPVSMKTLKRSNSLAILFSAFFFRGFQFFDRLYIHVLTIYRADNSYFNIIFFFYGIEVVDSFLVPAGIKPEKLAAGNNSEAARPASFIKPAFLRMLRSFRIGFLYIIHDHSLAAVLIDQIADKRAGCTMRSFRVYFILSRDTTTGECGDENKYK